MRYKNLDYLIGQQVELHRPLKDNQIGVDWYRAPDKVVVEAVYPKTVLVRIYYGRTFFRRMFQKSAMYCGDVRIRYGLTWLTGEEVMTP